MFAVIFMVRPKKVRWNDYLDLAKYLKPKLEAVEGFRGIRSFSHGHLDILGGDFYSINVACLDNADDGERAAAPVRFMDGRNKNWYAAPAETRHL